MSDLLGTKKVSAAEFLDLAKRSKTIWLTLDNNHNVYLMECSEDDMIPNSPVYESPNLVGMDDPQTFMDMVGQACMQRSKTFAYQTKGAPGRG